MLIASKNEGEIDGTEAGLAYLQRVAYLHTTPNLKPLIECGFLESASKRKRTLASARPETETEDLTEKKTKEVALRLPEWLPLEEWRAWLDVRSSLKCKNTPRALNLAVIELTRLKSLGFDPAKVLDQSTLKSWKSVYPLKPELVAVTAEPKSQLCDYCTKISTGTVNGRRSCDEHFSRAMGNEKPARIAA